MSQRAIKGRQFIHAARVTNIGPDRHDAVVVKEHVHYADGTHEPRLRIINAPTRRFYVSHKGVQETHTEKREWEDLKNLQEYIVPNHRLEAEVFHALNGYYPRHWVPMRKLAQSPYLYGADVSIEVLVKAHYQKEFDASGCKASPLTRGMFDVETSMLGGAKQGQLIMASITHENQVYTSILAENFFSLDAKGNRIPGDLATLEAMAKEILDPEVVFKDTNTKKRLKEHPFVYHFHIAEQPIDILRWTLGKMHENKTDFMGVWNLPFDMGVILKRCSLDDVNPADLLCPPDLASHYRKVDWRPDPGRKDEHYTRRWHWLTTTAYTQWYDAMCLYSTLRIVKGFENFYGLDYILRINDISDGKLKFKHLVPESTEMSSADWHRLMQAKHPYEYILYNMFDVMSLQCLEWKVNDAMGMYVLIGTSDLRDFKKQTRRSADALYFECLESGKVIATTVPADTEGDLNDMEKIGGAVLVPDRTDGVGLFALHEAPTRETYAHANVNDIDLSALYPSMVMGVNVSRETKHSMLRDIKGMSNQDIRHLSSMLIAMQENAVPIGHKFFNLPDYFEMDTLFKTKQST